MVKFREMYIIFWADWETFTQVDSYALQYLCIQNCKSGHKSPEWLNVVRSVMQTFKNAGRIVNKSRGSWELK
jgi:hypothetical protein